MISPKGLRVDVPDFSGKLDPQAFTDWMTALEDYFDWYGMTEERKVRFAKMKLKGQARIWWRNVEACINRLGQAPIIHGEKTKLK